VSAAEAGEESLNSDEVKAEGIRVFGELRHPTTVDYVGVVREAKQF